MKATCIEGKAPTHLNDKAFLKTITMNDLSIALVYVKNDSERTRTTNRNIYRIADVNIMKYKQHDANSVSVNFNGAPPIALYIFTTVNGYHAKFGASL